MQTNGNICYVYEMETLGLYRSKEDKDALSNGDTIMNQIYKANQCTLCFRKLMTLQLSLVCESEVSVLTCQARCVLWCSSGMAAVGQPIAL